ncbi:recombinase family protein [Staphylococcus kloosii]|jgi:DNA invertase Pin-like site-specific DNA recombinase|uniref:recombinase family protein n=1 Tax=Staphylococcus kloosii TaxID=29384 RepID=UPI00189EDA20|nr:recombinase family protein [Staphylococcus kloosii]MBF7030127.1 recombinase family protein [Staphylococcus kloosii]
MKYGYIRPVTINDSLEEQAEKLSLHTNNIHEENHAKNKNRAKLNELLDSILQPEDVLYVTDLCILADSTKHLTEVLDYLLANNISLHVINLDKEISSSYNESFIDTLHHIVEFQRDIVKFRTRLGIEDYTMKGNKVGRPKRDDKNLKDAVDLYMSKKFTLDEIKEKTNISRATLYRHLDR